MGDHSIQEDLSQLRIKLGRLGVDLALGASKIAGSEVIEAALNESRTNDREKDTLLDLLHRCNDVQRILDDAEVGASAGVDLDALRRTKANMDRSAAPAPKKKPAASGGKTRPISSAPARRPATAAAAASTSTRKPWLPPGLDGLDASMAKDGSMNRMIQKLQEEIKVMQDEATAREAALRRESDSWRKRSLALERDVERLKSQGEGRTVELKAARAALSAREDRLAAVEKRSRDAEETALRERQAMLRQVEDVAGERDDLKALLAATLKRLESVDEAMRRADLAQAVMEERVRTLESEREKALNELAMTRSELMSYSDAHRTLQAEHEILSRATRATLARNDARKEQIREALVTGAAGSRDATGAALLEYAREAGAAAARSRGTAAAVAAAAVRSALDDGSEGEEDEYADYGFSSRDALGIPPSLRTAGL